MMKKLYISIIALLSLASCNDAFMERTPIEKQTEITAFETYENFKTYSWSFYNAFANTGAAEDKDKATDNYTRMGDPDYAGYGSDKMAGWLMATGTTDGNGYRTASVLTPQATEAGGWNFRFVRRVNLMLSHIDKSKMNETEKNHWRSVGYFFRAYKYAELIARFGDVPWIDQVLAEDDPAAMGARTSRKEVADNVLADLQFAEKHIKVAGDGKNTINTDVVRALMSRFCLFEGTWRKYHKLGEEAKYLDECIRVSELLASKFPTVNPSYDALFTSLDLSSYQGMILYKVYATDLIMNNATRYERSEMGNTEMPKSTVEMYLCNNGRPISSPGQTLYDGDKTMNDEFRHRDRRLMLTVVPPFCMKKEVEKAGSPTFVIPTDPKKVIWNFRGYYDNPTVNNEEYMDSIDKFRAQNLTQKRLPLYNWSSIRLAIYSPHLAGTGESQMFTRSGYYVWRQTNYHDVQGQKTGIVDRPIFWIEEVLLNWAEASFEKNGALSQAVADATINKLRPRAGVAPMVVSQIDGSFDPARDMGLSGEAGDYPVDPVLWEIRRERMVELMGTGFGFYDIRRWKKGPFFINRTQIGAYLNKDLWFSLNQKTGAKEKHGAAWDLFELVNKDFSPAVGKQGYLKRFNDPKKLGQGWNSKYYLFPIPINDLLFNRQLKQNEGWDTPTGS